MQPYGLEKRFCDMDEAPKSVWSRKVHDRKYRKLGRGRARQNERKQIDEGHTPKQG